MKTTGADFVPGPIDYLLVKVASRCNIDCQYCYWFTDPSVYKKPKLMSEAVSEQLAKKIDQQVKRFSLDSFSLLFHGGEPLLWGKERFRTFFNQLSKNKGVTYKFSITTNGMLIDEEWAEIFRNHNFSVTVSIDGPRDIHDSQRVGFKGEGTFDRTIKGLRLLQAADVKVSSLAVYNPKSNAREMVDFFVNEAAIDTFDILIPEADHENPPAEDIAPFYNALFDIWFDSAFERGVDIRYPKSVAVGLVGGDAHIESFGFGPQHTTTILSDGTLEPLDVLRFEKNDFIQSSTNIFDNEIQDVVDDPFWRYVFDTSTELSDECKACAFHDACGGGYLPTRYSKQSGFNNPSVYCESFKSMFAHAYRRIDAEFTVRVGDKELAMEEAANGLV